MSEFQPGLSFLDENEYLIPTPVSLISAILSDHELIIWQPRTHPPMGCICTFTYYYKTRYKKRDPIVYTYVLRNVNSFFFFFLEMYFNRKTPCLEYAANYRCIIVC